MAAPLSAGWVADCVCQRLSVSKVSIDPRNTGSGWDCDCGRRNGKSSGRERTNRQVKETMAPAYGTKLYERALGLGALDQGIFGSGE
jgi:hypothetical protein